VNIFDKTYQFITKIRLNRMIHSRFRHIYSSLSGTLSLIRYFI